jgi:hypothetical protein
MPPQVRRAASLTLILALYALGISSPTCLVGSFVGPHILIPALVHAIVGLVLVVGLVGILNRRGWARWLLILVTGSVALGQPIALVREAIAGPIDRVGVLFWLTIALLLGAVTLNLASSAVRVWFTG